MLGADGGGQQVGLVQLQRRHGHGHGVVGQAGALHPDYGHLAQDRGPVQAWGGVSMYYCMFCYFLFY